MTNEQIVAAVNERKRLHRALEQIASTSPVLRMHGNTEERCIMCLALINEARAALGWQAWPAPSGTPVTP